MMLEQEPEMVGKLPQGLRIAEIFKVAEEKAKHGPEKLLTFVDGMQSFHAYAGEITLVMCRELRRAVGIASSVALKLALKFPERNVLIFNTYAGADLLTAGFVRALHMRGLKVPFTFQKYLPDAKSSDFCDTVDLPSPENLRVLDCPTATITPESLARDIERHAADVVILNSLEFAAFSDRRRKELAETLLELRYKKRITVFVFTHELRVILPYTGGRGAVGLLGAFSKSVWHLVEDWERRHWVNKLLQQIEEGAVNE